MGHEHVETIFSYLEYSIDKLASTFKLNNPVVLPDPPIIVLEEEIETPTWLFHWCKLISIVKTHDYALHICMGLLLAMIIIPVIIKVIKLSTRLGKWIFRNKMSVFKTKTQINMQMPEEYNEVNNIRDWLKQFDLFYKVNNVVDDDMK